MIEAETADNTAYTLRAIALALRDILLSQNFVYAGAVISHNKRTRQ